MENTNVNPKTPSPELIFEAFHAYQRTAALKAAIELDVFTAVGEGNQEPSTLARRCRASERGIRILCDYLTIIGLLEKEGAAYSLTPDSKAFLDVRSPAYFGGAIRFLNSSYQLQAFNDVAAAVRKGGALLNDRETVSNDHSLWVEFARGMAPMMAPAAEDIAEILGAQGGDPWKVLDIAAGHGLFGVAIARFNHQARIYALDWEPVLQVALENARKARVEDRYFLLKGSAFAVEFGSGYDLVLATNFFHHFDPETCRQLMGKIHAALKADGRLVTLEFIPNEDRVSPPLVAAFSFTMLATTPSGDAYPYSELERMLQDGGFRKNALQELPRSLQKIVISQP
ncbi:MAG: class I SAM-dependent methyltransferase [Acidobacteria bacterium]|nr:class I SAM-dependent methyltransferase [Acidobacteriota bacterium]